MKLENRKRNIQVLLRLTPEESDTINKKVRLSGINRNDFIIQTLIGKATLPMLSWTKTYHGDQLEIHCSLGTQSVGFASCSFIESTRQLEIRSLYVAPIYQTSNLIHQMLDEISSFAKEKQALSIKSYCCGVEPWGDGKQSIGQETRWYQDDGYQHTHDVMGIVPCMVKELTTEGASQ